MTFYSPQLKSVETKCCGRTFQLPHLKEPPKYSEMEYDQW